MNFYWFPYKTRGILWNSKDTPWIFHGIPWRFMENSIEIHGNSWSSTKFHGIPWRYLARVKPVTCSRMFWQTNTLYYPYLPTSSPMTKELATMTKPLNNKLSKIGSTDDEKPSSGIVLTAPIARFTKVTASEESISLFSNGSVIGEFSAKYIPYKPEKTKANPM